MLITDIIWIDSGLFAQIRSLSVFVVIPLIWTLIKKSNDYFKSNNQSLRDQSIAGIISFVYFSMGSLAFNEMTSFFPVASKFKTTTQLLSLFLPVIIDIASKIISTKVNVLQGLANLNKDTPNQGQLKWLKIVALGKDTVPAYHDLNTGALFWVLMALAGLLMGAGIVVFGREPTLNPKMLGL